MNKMKKITTILAVLGLLALTSCDFFLQKPDTTGTVDRDTVFGSKKNAENCQYFSDIFHLVHSLVLESHIQTECNDLGKRIHISASVCCLRVDSVRSEGVLECVNVVSSHKHSE